MEMGNGDVCEPVNSEQRIGLRIGIVNNHSLLLPKNQQ